MDPTFSDNNGDEEAAAMAAMMGFASFGTAPPPKKRKFNSATDAFVSGQELGKIDKGGKKGQGSGGNDIKLGKARVFGVPKKDERVERRDGEEIVLEDDDGEGGDGNKVGGVQSEGLRNARVVRGEGEGMGPQYLDTSLPAPADAGWDRGDSTGPAYMDTSTTASLHSMPPSQEQAQTDTISDNEAAEVQARIDALLNSISANPAPPPPSDDPDTVPEYLGSALQGSVRDIPNRAAGEGRGGRGGRNRGGLGQARGRGGRNEKWFEGYYDVSFNHNPWDKEEKKRGLQAMGVWLEHPSQGVGRGR